MLKIFKKVLNGTKTFIQKWWRPLTQLGLVGTIWVQGVILPIMTKTFPDLMGLSALVTAIVAAFAVRTYEKAKGMDNADTQ